MTNKPIDILPLRRGVVLRGDKITDSYGTEYVRDEGTGQLYRVSDKAPRNPPKRLFDLDAGMNAVELEKQVEAASLADAFCSAKVSLPEASATVNDIQPEASATVNDITPI